ncbi:MAG: transglutaminase family protein, partial [Planctomycetia bacterium]
MGIRVALRHKTTYRYDKAINLGPQVVRLRPAAHCRTPIEAYSLRITPESHFINWQQDPQGNYLARLVFSAKTKIFSVEVDVLADMTSINPFDFFLEDSASDYPFQYEPALQRELKPFLETDDAGPLLAGLVAKIDRTKRRTVDFLVDVNRMIQTRVDYIIRLEPGVQTSEATLTLGKGSCRDSAWLLVQALRHVGLAARFVSGYLIQLRPDIVAVDGPAGAAEDFTDLHAWTEVYLPGAGWVGLDPTSGMMAGEGHIPLACTPEPSSAAPITGTLEECETAFEFEMSVTRLRETPRITKPYTDEAWQRVLKLGAKVDDDLLRGDVRLTMGGEPTFVAADDPNAAEWNTAAVGPTKRSYASKLLRRLRDKYAPGGLLHFGQGKWYPGESLPRWAFSCYWRKDGQPAWRDPSLHADEDVQYDVDAGVAQQFVAGLVDRLELDPQYSIAAHEDLWYYLWKERRLPINVDALNSHLEDLEERERLARVYRQGVHRPVGHVLPLRAVQDEGGEWEWTTGPWFLRDDHLFLLPGDSPMGFRLPLDSLPWLAPQYRPSMAELDPMITRENLPDHEKFVQRRQRSLAAAGRTEHGWYVEQSLEDDQLRLPNAPNPAYMVRTALCVEPRDGKLFVFMPPTSHLEQYLDLAAAIEDTAAELKMPVMLEGYLPPSDHRLNHFKLTPDPGVIEVNIHPSHTWKELVDSTETLYEESRQVGLAAEKFMIDGKHAGTGGGNHIVLGGASPSESPFLRRPDLLRSLITYWNNHPSLSYLFSGMFVGPTSQAPRLDEARHDSLFEMEIALRQFPQGQCP